MIRNLMASSALVALISAGAISVAPAQTDPVKPAVTQDTAAAQDTIAAPAEVADSTQAIAPAHPTLASAIIGRSVYSSADPESDNIGDVNDLIVDEKGAVTHAVVGVGGFLGIGEKNVAVPFDQLKVVENNGDFRLVYSATKEQLTAEPAFDRTAYDPAARAPKSADTASNDSAGMTPLAPAASTDTTAAPTADQTAANAPAIDQTAPATDEAAKPADQTAANAPAIDQTAPATDEAAKPTDQMAADAPATDQTAPATDEAAKPADQMAANAPATDQATPATDEAAKPADQTAANAPATDQTAPATDEAAKPADQTAANAPATDQTAPATDEAAKPADQTAANAPATDQAATPPPAETTAPADTMAAAPAETTEPLPPEVGFVNASADQVRASTLMGKEVFGPENQSIGQISDLVLEKEGATRVAIVDVGGFLGIGEKPVAIPFADLKFAKAEGADASAEPQVTVAMTKDQLQSLPTFDTAALNDAVSNTPAGGTVIAPDATATAEKPADTTSTDTMAAAPATAPTDQPADQTAASTEQPADQVTTGSISASPVSQDIAASKLIGAEAYGTDDSDIGEVSDIVFDAKGDIDAIVVDVGGFLGIGEKPVALNFDNLNVRTDESGKLQVSVNATKDQLDKAPAFEVSSVQ